MIDWSALPLWLIFPVSLLGMVGAVEFGRWAGATVGLRSTDNLTMLVGALLGLLALMMSFTFSVALSRFDARIEAVLNEANAIGTTALRAQLLPEPQATESLMLLRQYTQLRLDLAKGELPPAEFQAELRRSNSIQEALWQEAQSIASTHPEMVPTGLYIQSLNEMIDDQGRRLTALRNRVPGVVVAALYGIALIAALFTGYSGSPDAPRSRVPDYIVGLVVVSVILLIQDLDRPTMGFITVSQQPMMDTALGLVAR